MDTVEKTDLPTTESESPPSDEKLPRDEIRPSAGGLKPKGRVRMVVALCILLITAPLIAGYFSYDWGYNAGYHNTSVSSYNDGYNSGNVSGYELGFNISFVQGNTSGYVQGYEIGCNDGNSSGYKTGYDVGYAEGLNDGAGHGFTVRDPTYQEMLNFIASDQTDKHQYTNPTYVCWNFAADVKNNAFTVGYRCGLVVISFADSSAGHSVICFKTIDHGLVFIEPQDDAIASLVIGQHYWDRTKYVEPTYDDTIVSFTIVW
jgi:hypothetical protein